MLQGTKEMEMEKGRNREREIKMTELGMEIESCTEIESVDGGIQS